MYIFARILDNERREVVAAAAIIVGLFTDVVLLLLGGLCRNGFICHFFPR